MTGRRPLRVLLTGAGGQVGTALAALGAADFDVHGLDRRALDIADADAVARRLDAAAPDMVVNCAAYTAVDRAEDEPQRAFRANAEAVGLLGRRCAERGIGIVHLSTDYVFDGAKTAPYAEDDAPNPLGVYGASKLAGEQALRAAAPRHVILRVAWVFGTLGRSFVDAIVRNAAERDELRVVDDQIGAPSPAQEIARTLRGIALRVEDLNAWGTYHFSTAPALSWCAFAREIVAAGHACGLLRRCPAVRPITSGEWPAKAARPLNSRLDAGKLQAAFGLAPPPWRDALARYLATLARGAAATPAAGSPRRG